MHYLWGLNTIYIGNKNEFMTVKNSALILLDTNHDLCLVFTRISHICRTIDTYRILFIGYRLSIIPIKTVMYIFIYLPLLYF